MIKTQEDLIKEVVGDLLNAWDSVVVATLYNKDFTETQASEILSKIHGLGLYGIIEGGNDNSHGILGRLMVSRTPIDF